MRIKGSMNYRTQQTLYELSAAANHCAVVVCVTVWRVCVFSFINHSLQALLHHQYQGPYSDIYTHGTKMLRSVMTRCAPAKTLVTRGFRASEYTALVCKRVVFVLFVAALWSCGLSNRLLIN
jgi:hypothetical protein